MSSEKVRTNRKKTRVKRLALCIGVSYYEKFSRLSGANDALAVAGKFIDPQVGEFERVRLVVDDFDVELKPGDGLPEWPAERREPVESVDRNRIETAVSEVFNDYAFEPDALLVIFFAGHGALNENGDLCLFGSDATRNRWNKQPDFLKAFNLNQLHQFLRGKNAPNNVVVMLDACYAGAATQLSQRLQPFNQLSENNQLQNIYVIGGASANESAGGDGRHGYFTSCLLEAFNQRPNDGWITMGRVQEYVAEHLPTIKRRQQQIEGLNRFGGNIRLVRKPLYEAESAEFCEEVQNLLRLDPDNWTISAKAARAEQPVSYFTATYGSSFTAMRWAVYCLYNPGGELWSELVWRAANYLRQVVGVERRMLVTARPIDASLQEVARRGCPDLVLADAEQLLRASIDFSEYDKRLVEQYHKGEQRNVSWRVPPLGEVYTSLRGEERRFMTEKRDDAVELALSGQKSGRSGGVVADITGYSQYRKDEKVWEGDLKERVLEWLETEGDSRLVLIGGYGTGKSSFCKHLAAWLIENKHQRKPVVIKLGDFAGRHRVDFRDFMWSHLSEAGAKGINPGKLAKWAEVGRLLFIFDGFDEMASRSSEEVRRSNLQYIEEWAEITGNKVLVTTRPEYFLTRTEEQGLLYRYRRLYYHLLGQEQINFYLQKRVEWHEAGLLAEKRLGWEAYRDSIKRIYDLSNLQHRFVLLEMIVKNLPEYIEQKRKEVTRVELYQDYLTKELDERKADDLKSVIEQLPTERRLLLLEEIAFRLYCGRENQSERKFSADEAEEWLHNILTPAERRQWEYNQSNFLTYSFLLPAGEDQFEFSHKSFLEFLVAQRLQRQLEAEEFRGMEVRPLTREIAGFLAEMKPRLEGLLEAADREEAMETLVYSAGQVRLAVRLYELSRRVVQQEERVVPDDSYVSCLEYQVFISDMAGQGSYYHPDHWAGHRFAAGMGSTPIAGLLDRDATDFCRWLNTWDEREDETGQEEKDEEKGKRRAYNYRLPTVMEGMALPIVKSQTELRAWCGEHPYFELAGGEEGMDKRIEVALKGLRMPIVAGMQKAQYHSLANIVARDLDLDINLDLVRDLDLALAFARDLARDFALTLARDLALARELDLALALARARELALALDLARVSVLDLARALALARTSVLALARELDLARASVLALARTSVLARPRASDLARALARASDLARKLDLDLARASDLSLHFQLEVVRAHLRALALTDDHASVLEVANARTLASANIDTLVQSFEFLEVEEFLKRKEWKAAIREVERIQLESEDKLSRRRVEFLLPLLQMAEAAEREDVEEYRRLQRAYSAVCGKLVCEKLMKMEAEEGKDYEEAKKIAARLYWREKIVEARRADPKFPVWEGLLLVCERLGGEQSASEFAG